MTAEHLAATARALLFVPGDRPDRFDKAHRCGADLVVVDLEDAVAPANKHDARRQLETLLPTHPDTLVRINATGTPWHEADVEAVKAMGATIMLPKAEDADEVAEVARRAAVPVIALVETAKGVMNAYAVASASGVGRLAFGSFDLAAQLGVSPEDRAAMASARGALVLASAAAGLPGPIDGVTGTIDDHESLRSDLLYARRLGFTGKLCIHPSQVDLVTATMRPAAEELAWARRVLAAVHSNPKSAGVAVVDGRLVDKPVLERAQRLLAAAEQDVEQDAEQDAGQENQS